MPDEPPSTSHRVHELNKIKLCGLTPFSTHNYVKPVGEMILGYILI
jgi:hypothetical protein